MGKARTASGSLAEISAFAFRMLSAGLILSAFFANAVIAKEPFTERDLSSVQSVRDITLSPDGEMTAYVLWRWPDILNGEQNGSRQGQLWLAKGEEPARPLTSADLSVSRPKWRGGERLTVVAKDEEDVRTLYEVDLEDGDLTKLFSFSEDILTYAYDGSGDTLFFTSKEAADPMLAARTHLGFNAKLYEEAPRFTRLYRVDLNAPKRAPFEFPLPGEASAFDVSPDGRRVVVALAASPFADDRIINRAFHIVNGQTGEIEHKIRTAGKLGPAAFSPDGRHIAFLAAVDRPDPIVHTLALADASSGAFRFLTGDDEADEIAFAWADNQSLHVLEHRSVRSADYRLSLDGEISNYRSHDGFVARDFDVAPERVAMSGSAPDHPRELFSAAPGAAPIQASHHNAWVKGRLLGEQTVAQWRARDGVMIDGIWLTPPGERPQSGWPTIVVVHGGPARHYANEWLSTYLQIGHIATGRGFAVFYPNYRGSSGRGSGFAKLDHADPPAEEFNDIVDGIAWLKSRGLINEGKVGITGLSYGGYASAWGATALSDLFGAAVIFAGLTDLISFHATTDIPVEMVDSHFMAYPEGAWEMYRTRSPIFHAEKSKTPTLIIHGDADQRVHVSQSLALYGFLKRQSAAPVRLVIYPREKHNLTKAAARYDYAVRLMQWMETYLVNEAAGDLPPVSPPEIDALVRAQTKD